MLYTLCLRDALPINEPDVDTTYQILKGLKSRYEEHHDLRYTDKSLKAAAELAARYINDRYMPDMIWYL